MEHYLLSNNSTMTRQHLILVSAAEPTRRLGAGDLVTTIHGEDCYVVASFPPRPPINIHGRVQVKFLGHPKDFLFFPQVIGARWISSAELLALERAKRRQAWLNEIKEQKKRKFLERQQQRLNNH